MSYTGSDDQPMCDVCDQVYPPFWPDGFFAPWPVTGPLMTANGRMTGDQRDNFHLCQRCVQDLVLAAELPRAARALAIASCNRWRASQALLRQVRAIARAVSEAA